MSVPTPSLASARPLTAGEVETLRADFPYLARPARNGEPLAYLDWGATSQKPAAVIEREADFLRRSNGAAGRSTYEIADEATAVWDDAHEAVGGFVGARPSQVVFTKNATEAVNLVALAIGHASLGRRADRGGEGWKASGLFTGATASAPGSADPGRGSLAGGYHERLAAGVRGAQALAIGEGDEIVVTRAEHHANLVPWQELAARTGARLRWLDLTEDGRIDLSTLSVITERTRVAALTHASNVTGAITPLAQILPAARAVGALTVLDTCQSGAHLPLDFATLAEAGVDAMVLSSHKMLGPTGIGALVATEELLGAMPPVLTGGSMIETVTMESSTYMSGPARFEAGSQPLAQAAGWMEAVGYLAGIGMDRLHATETLLTERCLAGMSQVPGVRVLGPLEATDRTGVIAFTVEGVHPHDVGQVLDAAGVAVRTGHHCAQPVHAHFGVHASARVSFGPTTTAEEIDRFLEALASVRSYFVR